MPLNRTYPVDIARRLPASELAILDDGEAARGEEDGLAGNQQYQDLRGASWEEVSHVLAKEAALIERFEGASDLDEEADRFEEERLEAVFPEDDLCGLDIGVAAATLAISALGATPVSSCNAGGFGGHHVARFPYVAFYLPRERAGEVLAIAEKAEVGLDIVDEGIARLCGRTDYDLHRFAKCALQVHVVEH